MSDTKSEEEKEQTLDADDHDVCPQSTVHPEEEKFAEHPKTSDSEEQDPLTCPGQEEEKIKKKYGGLAPKKLPLISKDHEHAFFDSADWALGKQGAQRSKGPSEALRPKLQPTPHLQVRSRSAYAPADDDGEGTIGSNNICTPPEDQSKPLDESDDNFHPDDQSHEN